MAPVPIIAWLVVAIAGLILLGGIVALVALLANPPTRAAGRVLLAFGLLLVVVLGVGAAGLLFSYRAVTEAGAVQQTQTNRAHAEVGRAAAELRPPQVDVISPDAEARPEPKPEAGKSDASAPSGTAILRAIGQALKGKDQPKNNLRTSEADPSNAPADPNSVTPAPPKTDEPKVEAEKPAAARVGPSAPSGEQSRRPPWVDESPHRDAALDAYLVVITVGPYTSRLECDAKLPEAVQGAVEAYVETYLGQKDAAWVRIAPDEAVKQLVKQAWEEPIRASFGPMTQLRVQLAFDSKFNDRIKQERTNARTARLLWYTGGGLTTGLVCLALLFVCLKINQTTHGAYRGRLGFLTVLAVVAAVALACYALQFLHRPTAWGGTALPQTVTVEPVSALTPAPSELVSMSRHEVGYVRVRWFPIVGLLAIVGLGLLVAKRETRIFGLILLGAVLVTAVIGAVFLIA